MISKKMLFITFWSIGMLGVVSILWTNLPIPEKYLPLPPIVIKLVNLVFPTFLLSIGVALGVNIAHKVGLSAIFFETIATGSSQNILLIKPQIVPGLIDGLVGGVVISLWFRLWESSLPSDFLAKGEELSKSTPLLTRILFGDRIWQNGIVDLWGYLFQSIPTPPFGLLNLDQSETNSKGNITQLEIDRIPLRGLGAGTEYST